MFEKLKEVLPFLLKDVAKLKSDVAALSKTRVSAVGRDGRHGRPGRDGASPDIKEVISAVLAQIPRPKDGETPDTKAIIQEVLAKLPEPRDGRDSPPVNVSDVAEIIFAKIPKPKDGLDGKDGPTLDTVVRNVRAQLSDGKQGPPGPKGDPGEDGVSITDVELKNNDLFVSLDGKRKKVGAIKIPVLPASFTPASSGGGGGRGGKTRPVTLDEISATIGNFQYIDEPNKIKVVDGEHEIPNGTTIEFVDNAVTGMPPLFTKPIRIGDGENAVIQAPLTLSAIVYTGTGGFIRSDDLNLFVQNNVVFVTPNGPLYDLKSVAQAGICFTQNFAYLGFGLGTIKGVQSVSMRISNVLARENGLLLENCTTNRILSFNEPLAATGTDAALTISGGSTQTVQITDGTASTTPGRAYIDIRPDISGDATLIVKDNAYQDSTGGDFFQINLFGDVSIFADNSSTGSITAFADNGAGGTTVTSVAHSLVDGRAVTISATTSYNGTFDVSGVTANTYDIPVTFVADDATGTWDFNSITVTTVAPHGLSDGAAVQLDKTTNYNVGRVIFGATASTFDMDNVVFNGDDAAGKWSSSSIGSNDTRMRCRDNGDQADTAQILNLSAIGTIGAPVESFTGGAESIVTAWTPSSDDQYTFNPPGQPMGTWRYDGKKNRSRNDLIFEYIAASGNPAETLEFRLYKSTDGGAMFNLEGIPATGVLSNVATEATVFSIFSQSPGDLFQIRYINTSGTAQTDIIGMVMASTTVATG